MVDDELDTSRRRVVETVGVATVWGTAGCLRLSGGGDSTATGAGSQGGSTATRAPATATQSPRGTAESDPAGATFEFTYRTDSRAVVVTYDGGGRLRAGAVRIESTTGNQIAWPELGSTIARSDEVLSSGATAVLGPDVLNWGDPIRPDETIRVVFDGGQSVVTLGRYSSSTESDAATDSSSTESDAATDSSSTESDAATATVSDGVEISFSDSVTGSVTSETSNGAVVAARPAIDLQPATPVRQSVRFEITNVDTGDTVEVRVTSEQTPETLAVILNVNDAGGELKTTDTMLNCWTGSTFVDLNVEVDGDKTTFTSDDYGTYRITMFDAGGRVAQTDTHVVPVNHQLGFEHTVEDGSLQFGFDAGELPSDASLNAVVDTDGQRIVAEETSYEQSSNRYVGRVSTDDIPSGTHTVRVTVSESGTGIRFLSLEGTVSV
jgi:hypothetical protein